jgi:hypothetical protein
MSFLETGKGRYNWIAATKAAKTSLAAAPGCAQCGSQLEMNDRGKFNHSGKCANCVNGVCDEDEDFDELED